MQYKRLPDPLMRVLFENDDIIAVDKPYGISSHTNDSKVGNEGYIQHGLIELFESQLERKLHIVHRLDRTTTGVIIFAKSLEAAAKFQGYFRNRETEKTYVFVTRSQVAATTLHSNDPITVKGVALEAETSFTRLTRTNGYDLWQARPKTGRNHQIRVHASSLGIPLLGDTLYGGERYPFICLHNQSIQFPGNLKIESPPPAYFTDLKWLSEEWFATQLHEFDLRARVFGAETSPLRLAPGQDYFGDIIAADEGSSRGLARLATVLKRDVMMHAKDHWVRLGPDGEESPNERTEWIIDESGVKYELRAGVGAALGLPLEQRHQRNWLRTNSKDREVLNLFAGNCTLACAAAVGGGSLVTSVETKKSAIEWGRKNAELNALDANKVKFFCRDPFAFIQANVSKNITADIIVCDVPSFLRRDRGIFKIETDLENLLIDCFKCLRAKGDLMFSTTASSLQLGDLRKIIESAAKKARLSKHEIWHLLPTLDIAIPGEAPETKSFLIRKD